MFKEFFYFHFQVAKQIEAKKHFTEANPQVTKSFITEMLMLMPVLSKRQVQKCILGIENLRKLNIKLPNKSKPCPVSVKEIHKQHHIDLVDIKKHGSRIREEDLPVHPVGYGDNLSIPLASSFDDKRNSNVKKEDAKDLQDS